MANTYEDLNKAYKRLTGVVNYDFQTLSDASAVAVTDTEKEKLYHDVIWHIPGGRYLEVNPYKDLNSYVVNSAAKITGVSLVEGTDIDRDNDIDNVDSNVFSYATPLLTQHTITFSNNDKGSETKPQIKFKGEYKFTAKSLTYFKDVVEGEGETAVTYTQSKWEATFGRGTVDVNVGDTTNIDTTVKAIWEVKA